MSQPLQHLRCSELSADPICLQILAGILDAENSPYQWGIIFGLRLVWQLFARYTDNLNADSTHPLCASAGLALMATPPRLRCPPMIQEPILRWPWMPRSSPPRPASQVPHRRGRDLLGRVELSCFLSAIVFDFLATKPSIMYSGRLRNTEHAPAQRMWQQLEHLLHVKVM